MALPVTERTLTFRAVAVQDDTQQPVQTVRVNGSTVTGSGDLYTAQLRAGANDITVEAGGRIGLTESYTVTYTAPSFRIDTLFSDGQTRTVTADTPSGGSETVTVEGGSENARVWVSVEGVTGLETLRSCVWTDAVSPRGRRRLCRDPRPPRPRDADAVLHRFRRRVP